MESFKTFSEWQGWHISYEVQKMSRTGKKREAGNTEIRMYQACDCILNVFLVTVAVSQCQQWRCWQHAQSWVRALGYVLPKRITQFGKRFVGRRYCSLLRHLILHFHCAILIFLQWTFFQAPLQVAKLLFQTANHHTLTSFDLWRSLFHHFWNRENRKDMFKFDKPF